ncbi:MAG: hypothetical protein Q9187_006795 [Circinaria calcarea]
MHSFSVLATALLATVAIASPIEKRQIGANGTNPRQDDAALIEALILAPTAVERLSLLQPEDFIFDFLRATGNSTNTIGLGGRTVNADRTSFPALIGSGVSMTVGFLGPCGFNTPHIHPRSSEINIVAQGALVAEFTLENGLPTVVNPLTQWQMTVFPMGAMHTEFNPLCEPSVFVAGFADEDPGVQATTPTFFGFQSDIVRAALGGDGTVNGQDIDAFRTMIPRNVALGVDSCLEACGIQRR